MLNKIVYGIYGKDTLPVFIGTNAECAKYLGITINKFWDYCNKLKSGRIKKTKSGYTIEAICKESDLED